MVEIRRKLEAVSVNCDGVNFLYYFKMPPEKLKNAIKSAG